MNLVFNEVKENNVEFINYLDGDVNLDDKKSNLDFLLNYFAYGSKSNQTVERDFYNLDPDEFFNKYELNEVDFKNHSFSRHIGWFNFKKLKETLIGAGFSEENIKRSAYLDSAAEEMRDKRFFDQTIPKASLFVECTK